MYHKVLMLDYSYGGLLSIIYIINRRKKIDLDKLKSRDLTTPRQDTVKLQGRSAGRIYEMAHTKNK